MPWTVVVSASRAGAGRASPLAGEHYVLGDRALLMVETGATDPDLVRFDLQDGTAAVLATGVSQLELHADRGYAWFVSLADLYAIDLTDDSTTAGGVSARPAVASAPAAKRPRRVIMTIPIRVSVG